MADLRTEQKLNELIDKRKQTLAEIDGRSKKAITIKKELIELEKELSLVEKTHLNTSESLSSQIQSDIKARISANDKLIGQSGKIVDVNREINTKAQAALKIIDDQNKKYGDSSEQLQSQRDMISGAISGTSDLSGIQEAILESKRKEEKLKEEGNDRLSESQGFVTQLLESMAKKAKLDEDSKFELEAANKLTGGLFGKGKGLFELFKQNKGLLGKTLALGALVGLMAGLVSLAKKFAEGIDKIGETFGSLKILGGDVTKNLLNSENSAVRLGFGIADVASVTNTLASEFGVSLENASELSSQVLDTAKATGLSVDEATKLTGQLRIIAGLTADQSENLIESTFQLARQAGVAPQQVLKDIAASSETVAKFTKGTGENLFEAAVAARQLGISVDSIAKAARSTLDFESSVASELEASILLGQNINLQRARQLALNKDLVGFQEEIKNQLGDIGNFNELGIFQQESLAKAVGMSVEEVARLVSGTEKLTVAGALSAGTFDDLSGQEALSRLSSLTGLFNQISKTLLNELGPVFEDILSNLVAFLGNEQNIQKITNTIRNLASVVGFLAQNLSIVGLLLGAAAGASFGLPGIIIGAVAGAGAGYALQNAGGGSALPSMDTNFGGGGTTNNRSQADTQAIVNAINNINVSSTLTDRQIRVTLDNIGG